MNYIFNSTTESYYNLQYEANAGRTQDAKYSMGTGWVVQCPDTSKFLNYTNAAPVLRWINTTVNELVMLSDAAYLIYDDLALCDATTLASALILNPELTIIPCIYTLEHNDTCRLHLCWSGMVTLSSFLNQRFMDDD